MADKSISRTFRVLNRYGIHARPAAMLVQAASKYNCDITIEKDGYEVSCKSIMGLLTLTGEYGSKVTLTATGEDAEDALNEIGKLFANKFGEE